MRHYQGQMFIRALHNTKFGYLKAINPLAQRYFEGKGIDQSLQRAFYSSLIRVPMGLLYFYILVSGGFSTCVAHKDLTGEGFNRVQNITWPT